MIDESVIKGLVEDWLQNKDYFLVDVEVSKDDEIIVEINHVDGTQIEDCAESSRYIEDRLDRDDEDYELEVGSAGLGQPLKVLQQYINFIGKEVEVLDGDGLKYRGVLKSVDGNNFVVTTDGKMKVEGKKRPELQAVDHTFRMDKVKYTKYLVNSKQ